MVKITGWPLLLCCLNYQNAICIDITIIITSLVEIILNILNIAIIPWDSTSTSMKALLAISIVIFFISLIFSAIIIYFSKNKKLYSNEKIYNITFCFPIIAILLIIISLILTVIIFGVVVKDITSNHNNNEKSNEEIAKSKKLFIIISLIIIFIISIFLIMLWASIYLILKFKANSSYYNQLCIMELESLKQKNKSEKSSIVGHDKNGNPVFGTMVGNTMKVTTLEDTVNDNIKASKNFTTEDENKNISRNTIYDKYRSRSKSNTQVKKYDLTCGDIIGNFEKDQSKFDLEGGVIVDAINNNNSINPGY